MGVARSEVFREKQRKADLTANAKVLLARSETILSDSRSSSKRKKSIAKDVADDSNSDNDDITRLQYAKRSKAVLTEFIQTQSFDEHAKKFTTMIVDEVKQSVGIFFSKQQPQTTQSADVLVTADMDKQAKILADATEKAQSHTRLMVSDAITALAVPIGQALDVAKIVLTNQAQEKQAKVDLEAKQLEIDGKKLDLEAKRIDLEGKRVDAGKVAKEASQVATIASKDRELETAHGFVDKIQKFAIDFATATHPHR